MILRVVAVLALAACAEASPEGPDPDEVLAAFEGLHAPIYDVYALGLDRDAVHDHLAARFVGEALTTQYVTHWSTLVRMHEEGTGIQVTAVEYDDVEVLDPPPVPGRTSVAASWFVRGVVRHRQHRHPRINRYRAVYDVIDTDDGLRIVETRLVDLSRIRSEVPTDGVFDVGAGSASEEGFMDPLEMFEAGLFDAPDDTDAAQEAAP